MPVSVQGRASRRLVCSDSAGAGEQHLLIGLVNSMPASSRRATERQFRNLMGSAAAGIPTKLSIFVSQVPPGSGGGARTRAGEQLDLRDLWRKRLDGLIVTGSEPVAECLTHEPNWHDLADLVDWAEHNTYSTIWSCLAAHAAVYRIDGIPRRRLSDKLFGLFECEKAADDPLALQLTAGFPDRFWLPHSRWNDLSEGGDEMSALGYRTLTRSRTAGIDSFIRKRRSLFVFCQGHPEYEADSLLLEYRRDVVRFLRREKESYPELPCNYFDCETETDLGLFKERALADRDECLLQDFSVVPFSSGLQNPWNVVAVRFYRNWLLYLREQKMVGAGKRSGGFMNVSERPPKSSEPWKNLV